VVTFPSANDDDVDDNCIASVVVVVDAIGDVVGNVAGRQAKSTQFSQELQQNLIKKDPSQQYHRLEIHIYPSLYMNYYTMHIDRVPNQQKVTNETENTQTNW
jgi:hypothetical protein